MTSPELAPSDFDRSQANTGPFRAAVFDLDGTLLADTGEALPATRRALDALRERGIVVMLATGRSEVSTLPVARDLGLETPAVIFNGAAVLCPRRGEIISASHLRLDQVERSLAFATERGAYPVVMIDGEKRVPHDRSGCAKEVLRLMHEVRHVDDSDLAHDTALRVSLYSREHPDAAAFERDFAEWIDEPLYLTSFPLRLLPGYRDSHTMVLDIHAPCPGKAVALDVLRKEYGIPPEAVVAFGDAGNDIPLLQAAGLGIAMGNAAPEIQAHAKRVIGPNESDTIAHTLAELFG